jgi:hypothetical protein
MPSCPLLLTSTNVPRAEDAESARCWCVVSIVEAGGGRWKVEGDGKCEGGGWGVEQASNRAVVKIKDKKAREE